MTAAAPAGVTRRRPATFARCEPTRGGLAGHMAPVLRAESEP